MTKFQIAIGSDGYSARRNTEDGPIEIWVDLFPIIAEAADGSRWQWGDVLPSMAIAKSILRNLEIGTPDTSEKWTAIDPRYGSDAWGDEEEYNLACFEADCFNEQRPNWF